MSNPHEEAARSRKVSALLVVCRRVGMTAAQARRATADQRELAARIAGVRRPSDQTWDQLSALLEAIEAEPRDPFAGIA